jgi:competence protein ComEA
MNNNMNKYLGFCSQSFKAICLAVCLACTFVASGSLAVEPERGVESEQIVNINTADAETLAQALNGVGEAKAEAIVAWREANGSFTSLEQLTEVKGIGAATLEKNRHKLRL